MARIAGGCCGSFFSVLQINTRDALAVNPGSHGHLRHGIAPPDIDEIGAAEGIRTPDPRITNALLYQLSYRGAPTKGVLVIPGKCKRKER
jgi:hypothetical protein